MELQVNPGPESLKLMLYIAGSIILVLLTIIGFFLGMQIRTTTRINDIVTRLQAISELTGPVTERRLNAHAEQLDDHEGRIKDLENDHKHFHKKIN